MAGSDRGGLDAPGVRAVEWDQFEEKAVVVYKPKKISEERIQQLVADAGHDTDLYTATDEAYNGLEACCLYRTGCGCSDRRRPITTTIVADAPLKFTFAAVAVLLTLTVSAQKTRPSKARCSPKTKWTAPV